MPGLSSRSTPSIYQSTPIPPPHSVLSSPPTLDPTSHSSNSIQRSRLPIAAPVVSSEISSTFGLLTVCHARFATSPTYPYHSDARDTYLLPITVSVAKLTYGLSSSTLSILPTIRTLPGLYGREKSNFRSKRLMLCLPSTAKEYGIKQHGS